MDAEKGGTHALHMNEKNMLRNYSPKQLLHELTLVVMHIASPFLGLSDKAARQANRKCGPRWSVLFASFIFCSTKWALVTISGPYEKLTWLRSLVFEGFGALRQLWISIGSFVKQKGNAFLK